MLVCICISVTLLLCFLTFLCVYSSSHILCLSRCLIWRIKRQFYELNDHENAFRNITKTHEKSVRKRIDLKIEENHRSSHIVQRTSDEEISDSACSDKTVLITLDGRSHAVSVAFLLQVVRKICTASICTVSACV